MQKMRKIILLSIIIIFISNIIASAKIINTAEVSYKDLANNPGSDTDTAVIIIGKHLAEGIITPGTGGVVVANDGTKIEIGPGVVNKTTKLIISIPIPSPTVPELEEWYEPIGVFREFTFSELDMVLNGQVNLTLTYTDTDIQGKDEDTLRIYQLKEDGKWTYLEGGVISKEENTISISISDHLSIYGIMGTNILKPAYCYPNPFIASKHKEITFANLTQNIRLRIYTITGELVYDSGIISEPKDRGIGTLVWKVKNKAGEKVASGIYIYLLTNTNGDKKRGRLGIIR
jgi:hypothetical protein